MGRRKPVLGRARVLYCGLTLAEWRGTIATLRRSGWWVWGSYVRDRTAASDLHYAVIQAAALLLPASWHKANAGRFSRLWYDTRRSMVNGRFYWRNRPPFQEGPSDPPTV